MKSRLKPYKSDIESKPFSSASVIVSSASGIKQDTTSEVVDISLQDISQQNISSSTSASVKRLREEEPRQIGEVKRHKIPMRAVDVTNIQDFVSANRAIVIFRPINEAAIKKLEQESFLGKGLNIKGKSALYGPIKGAIPYDAYLSKAINFDSESLVTYQRYNDKIVEQSNEYYVKFLSEKVEFDDRIQKLKNNNPDFIKTAEYAQLIQAMQNKIYALNQQLLVRIIPATVETGSGKEKLYYFKRSSESPSSTGLKNQLQDLVLRDGTGKARFAIQQDGKFNFCLEEYLIEGAEVCPSGYVPCEVQLLSYVSFKLDETTGQIEEKEMPLAADYDELVSAPMKFYPFSNKEHIETLFSKSLHDSLMASETTRSDEIIKELIYQYEECLKKSHRHIREIPAFPYMGIVNDMQLVTKPYLKELTGGNINHSAEVYSPHPQGFREGEKYLVFQPSSGIGGKVNECEKIVLKSETEICEFINKKRAEGYPLDVHPKWGWAKNEERLEIYPSDDIRFDVQAWKQVDSLLDQMKEQHRMIEKERDDILKSYGIIVSINNIIDLKKIEWFSEEQKANHSVSYQQSFQAFLKACSSDEINEVLFNQLSRLNDGDFYKIFSAVNKAEIAKKRMCDEEKLINLKLNIKRLELEPDIVYGSAVPPEPCSRLRPKHRANQALLMHKKIANIEQAVRKKEQRERNKEIAELQADLEEAMQKYEKIYKESCTIEWVKQRLENPDVGNQSIVLEEELNNAGNGDGNFFNLRLR